MAKTCSKGNSISKYTNLSISISYFSKKTVSPLLYFLFKINGLKHNLEYIFWDTFSRASNIVRTNKINFKIDWLLIKKTCNCFSDM